MFTASHNVNEHRFERVSGWRDVKNYFNSIENREDKSHRSLYLMAYDFIKHFKVIFHNHMLFR